jgi:hypothetical protein
VASIHAGLNTARHGCARCVHYLIAEAIRRYKNRLIQAFA